MWEAIVANKFRSRILILLMGLLLIGLGGAIGGAVDAKYGPLAGMGIAFFIWIVMLLTALYQGDDILLNTVGANEIQKEHYPQLFNIVEEMKIASGLSQMPRIYVVEDSVPNAFAVGRKPEAASIAVTTGLLQKMNRDELQGVVAHEIGHIVNYDIRFMTIASILVGSIAMISDGFLRSMRYAGVRTSGRKSSNSQAEAVFFIIAILLAFLAPVVARLLHFACSRKREYLADACSAQYTRYPLGLASALQKISGRMVCPVDMNRIMAPMYIVSPLEGGTSLEMFSTHPPTQKRIEVLKSMAGGAGYMEYERAFEKVNGKGCIGARSMASSSAVQVREPSADNSPILRTEKIEQVAAVKDLLSVLGNFIVISCACGMKIKLPPQFNQPEVKCPRCGTVHPVPSATPDNSAPVADASTLPPLEYQRQGKSWETFKCACGTNVQLSPVFAGNRIRCKQCKRLIQINPAS